MTNENKLFNRVPYKHVLIGMWAIVLAGVFTFFGLFVYVANTKMPDTQELENPEFEQSSIVYSEDMVEIDRYFQRNRQWVKFDQLSPNLIDALIATEDLRFYRHSGIDAKGTGRAIAFLGARGGASTITQQLAKQFFTEKRSLNFAKRVWQKMKEWVIAIEFERRYTKEEILAMFLNKFDFRYQANGVGAAANIYFGKDQKDLTVPEAAMLVGMLKNPYLYSPISFIDRALQRRNVVLGQMEKYDFVAQERIAELKQEPLDMSQFSRGENYKGLAPHFMSILKQHIKELFDEENITKPGGEKFNLDTDGLEIYTTIDSRYQRHAEQAARAQIKGLQKRFEEVWKNRDPWTYIDPRDDLTKEEIEQQINSRNYKLSELVEKTDLYIQMRFRTLNSITSKITEEITDARLWNGDINRILKAEKDPDYLDELIKKEFITPAQKATYRKVLNSKDWLELKNKWFELKADVKSVFNKEKLTTVYSYDGPREVLMSPIDSIKYMANFLQIGSMSLDPKTGFVKAWIGGANYDIWKYDHVTSRRQVGSTFKPFLYTAAVNNAISPCWKVRDMQYVIPAGEPPFKLIKTWSPKNSRGEFTDEEITLKEGLKQSKNSVSVYLVKQLGSVRPIVETAEIMGITEGRIPEYPSIVLGSPTLSVMEMSRAYTTYANDGISSKPVFIKKIVYNGVSIYEEQPEQHRALASNVNYAMVDLLKHASSVVDYKLKTEFGGKTGTTNNHVDGWYMGITPNLVTGTWVGGSYNWIRFLTLTDGQGGRMARPFFLDYMERIEADEEINFDTEATFHVPEEIGITLDCEAYNQFTRRDSTLSDEIEMFDDFQ